MPRKFPKNNDPYHDMALFLTGAITATLHHPNITDTVRDFELLGSMDKPEVLVRFLQSEATYRIRVESLGAMDHDAAVAMSREEETQP